MFWHLFIGIAVIIILLLIVFFVFVCRRMFEIAFVRDVRFPLSSNGDGFEKQIEEHADMMEKGKAFFEKAEKEDVTITSFDGLKLHATLIRNGDCGKIVLLAHGFHGSGLHDFGSVLPFYYEHGLSMLIIDERAHGQSEGKYITYGVLERIDVCDWASYIVEKINPDAKIILHGISMGASTVLMASVLSLPQNVCGVIADSGFTSPYDILAEVLEKNYHIGTFPFVNAVGIMAETKANFGLRDATTLDAMAENKLPVLFAHGDADDFVPIEMTKANFEACTAPKKLIIGHGARHACSYLTDREEIDKALLEFFDFTMKNE